MIQLRYIRSRTHTLVVTAAALLLLAAGVIFTFISTRVHAATESIGGSSSFSGLTGRVVEVDDLEITSSLPGDPTLSVRLFVSEGYLHLASTEGIEVDEISTDSTLYLDGPLSDLNAALATLTYTSYSEVEVTLEVSLVGAGEVYFPDNGHIYKVVSADLNWEDSLAAATGSTAYGQTGYLTTITSEEENDFVAQRLSGPGWMGASDQDTEGTWEWVNGPEAGDAFWLGDNEGEPVDDAYSNWDDSEPNDVGEGEDCAQFLAGESSTGRWNDLPCTSMTLPAYVAEYGDDTPLDVPYKVITITVSERPALVMPGGDGTSVETPYWITDCEELQAMNQDLGAYYLIKNNIDCSEATSWNNWRGFEPVGNGDAFFTGHLQGDGKQIQNLIINRADDSTDYTEHDESHVGLFGFINDATIDDVHLVNVMIKGYEDVGGIAGTMMGSNAVISNSSVNADVESNDCDPGYCIWARYGYNGGGIVGRTLGGALSNVYSGGPVKGSGQVIGGLVGYIEDYTEVEHSASSSDVDGGRNIGGAVGQLDNGILVDVSASGDVVSNRVEDFKAGFNAGGLVGSFGSGAIEQSYATGDVHADSSNAGGFVGYMQSTALVYDSYATGDVSAGVNIAGGFVGNLSGDTTIERAYSSGNVTAGYTAAGFAGYVSGARIASSFSVGEVVVDDPPYAGFIGENDGGTLLSANYFDAHAAGTDNCWLSAGEPGGDGECTAIDTTTALTSSYFTNPFNFPFSDISGPTQFWASDVWFFDGHNLPILHPSGFSDSDGDSIANHVEQAAPHGGDANYDGQADRLQGNVASFVSSETDAYVALAAPEDCDLQRVVTGMAAVDDDTYTYPTGLLGFELNCSALDSGFTVLVTLYYYDSDLVDPVLRKYNYLTGEYQTVEPAEPIEQRDGFTAMTYALTDGGPLDMDQVANNSIIDPIGLGITGDDSQSGGDPEGPNTGIKPGSLVLFVVAGAAGVLLASLLVVFIRRGYKVT